jgi:hypothetical protein
MVMAASARLPWISTIASFAAKPADLAAKKATQSINDKSEAREIRRTIVTPSINQDSSSNCKFLLLCEFPAVRALDPTARVQKRFPCVSNY